MKCVTMDTNVASGATGQYKKFNFNSMMRFRGKVLGANSNGLYIVEGTQDNTAAIEAWIKTGITDLGMQTTKRLHAGYFTGECSGTMLVEVYADEVLVATRVIAPRKTTETRTKVKLGSKSTKGQTHAFLVRNANGADFAIDTIGILPAPRAYGHI